MEGFFNDPCNWPMTLTPCISLCKIEDGKCLGCNRTKEQIAKWRSYTDQERYEIMKDLGYGKRKGGKPK